MTINFFGRKSVPDPLEISVTSYQWVGEQWILPNKKKHLFGYRLSVKNVKIFMESDRSPVIFD